MKIYDIEKVRNPILYISIALISGSLFWGFYINNKYIWLAVLAASLFFIVTYLNNNAMFTLVICLFFILSLGNSFNYYNLKVRNNFTGEVIINQKMPYYITGTLEGRSIEIKGIKDEVKVGEKVTITGVYTKNINFENGIIGTIKVDKVTKTSETFIRKLYKLREKVYEKLKENIGQRKSALISSVAFGYTDNLDEEDKKEMNNFGVIHAVSVSGLHVALIYSVLKRILGIKFSLIFTMIYVLLTGAAFSSIRAFIMIVLLNMGILVRKTYNPLGALAFSAGLITLIKPYAPFKIGFQLSFLAVLGIILFSKPLMRKLYRLPQYLNNTLSVCISAQVFTLPIMLLNFGKCSLLFLLGNITLVPLLNLLIYLGNAMLIMVYIPGVFDFLSYAALKIINIFDDITNYFDVLFTGTMYINKNTAILYFFILLSLYFFKHGEKKMIVLPLIALMVIMINIYSPFLKIDTLRKGSMLISYKGERNIISNSRNVDMKKLKAENMAKEGYRKAEKISIGKDITMTLKGKDYILEIKGKEYLLRLSNKENENENYDIINFEDKNEEGFYIINDKLYCF